MENSANVQQECSVTVIMPVFNAVAFLPAALASILNQTRGTFELLVVDDGSTDGSDKVLAACTDPRLRVVTNCKNIGYTRSIQRACTGIRRLCRQNGCRRCCGPHAT